MSATKQQTAIDPSANVALNPVTLSDGRKVSWAEAFPRDSFKVADDVRRARGDLS